MTTLPQPLPLADYAESLQDDMLVFAAECGYTVRPSSRLPDGFDILKQNNVVAICLGPIGEAARFAYALAYTFPIQTQEQPR